MRYSYIKTQVKILMLLHNTKDIYFLCNYYKISILYENITCKGIFYIDEKSTNFIFFKKGLTSQEEIDILIHEFGHYILHKKYLLHRRS